AATDRPVLSKHSKVVEHAGMIETFDLRNARRHTGRENDLVEISGFELRRRHAGAEPQIHTGDLDPAAKVTQRLEEFFLTRNLLGQVELAADLRVRFEQGHI